MTAKMRSLIQAGFLVSCAATVLAGPPLRAETQTPSDETLADARAEETLEQLTLAEKIGGSSRNDADDGP